MGCNSESNLEWEIREGYRWAELTTGYFGDTGFEQLSSFQTNIDFRNDLTEDLIKKNRYYMIGSGVAAGDIDDDGLVDLYFASIEGPNRLYKNLGGFEFKDITKQAGLEHKAYHSTGVVFADVNGSGYPDLLVTSHKEGNELYINDGKGNFTLKKDSGLGESKGSLTMALADVNGNSYLDLYLTNYNTQTARDVFSPEELSMENTTEVVNGELRVLPEFQEYFTIIETAEGQFRNEIGNPDELYLNQGDGTFDLANDSLHFLDEKGNPLGLKPDWGLTATFRDINGDQLPDLYVANDFWTPDRFWINQGKGIFREIESHAIRNKSYSSMGVDFSDINRDGHLDFTVTEMLSQIHQRRLRQYAENMAEYNGHTMHNRNSVYLNRGDNTFAQIAHYSGLEASEWSWATNFLDIDMDGYEDLIVATGNAYDYQDMDTQIARQNGSARMSTQGERGITNYPPLKVNNKIFHNNGDLTFTEKSRDWGFDDDDLSMGMAFADLNNDGSMDVIINRLNSVAAVYKNETTENRIAVRLKGEGANSFGIGAKVKLAGTDQIPVQEKEITAGGSYLSGSQPQVVFAAEEENHNQTITVKWRGEKISQINGVQPNRIYEVSKTSAIEPKKSGVQTEKTNRTDPIFEDASNLITHEHYENTFNDYKYAPLLSQELSHQGPGVAWIDITRNGRDELLIGSGKDGKLAFWENKADGQLESKSLGKITEPATGDQTSIIGWSEGNETRIVVGSANYEQGNTVAPSAYVYSVDKNGNIVSDFSINGTNSTTGPIAATDLDNNGYVDLFIGGRFQPGRYPVDANSRLFMNDSGNFKLHKQSNELFADLGLATGAVFSDLTGNGWPDLLVSTEWGTLRMFANKKGEFQDVTTEVGLDQFKGWWQGLTTGDFTGNGLPDIVATNIGQNSPYNMQDGKPIRIYYDDFNRDGRLDLVEAYYDKDTGSYVPRRRLYNFGSIQRVLRNVKTHTQFANATLDEIFDRDFDEIPHKDINNVEHMIFINQGGEFKAHPLPASAQFTAGFDPSVADVNNDGKEDLFISQNFFGFPKHIPRLDAGRGLLLRGDGRGNFSAVSGMQSGVKVYGEQRGAAFSDINTDGKVDLVVTQNSEESKLFLNRTERKGLRITLKGLLNNVDAIGSSIRMVYSDGTKGPQREIQAGSGHWSQESFTQVMGVSPDESLSGVEVNWFNQETETIQIPKPHLHRDLLIFYPDSLVPR